MSATSDALIKKVCMAFPDTFAVEPEDELEDSRDENTDVHNEHNSSTDTATNVKYWLDGVLGSGATGTVLYARRVEDNSPFAIKIMDVGGLSAQDRMRASNEVCCLLSCDYFSIIKCHEDLVWRDSHSADSVQMLALVLDYADAGDLRQEIRSRAKTNNLFAEHEAGLLFIQVLLAVHHVHHKRMIHRDIKSANILLCSNGLVKLGDFGFSKHYAATVSDDVGRTFCGTPYYVAPEIWRRKPYSKKADMFSLGVLLYELLTLKRPFDGNDIEEVMRKILIGEYDPLPSTVSADMQSIVNSLLQSDPSKRPSSKKLLCTPLCKLYMSVVQEIVHNEDLGEFTEEEEKLVTDQLKKTKEELQLERKKSNVSIANVLKHASPIKLSEDGNQGYILYSGTLSKQSSDLNWKKRYVCIYGEISKTEGSKTNKDKSLKDASSVSKDLTGSVESDFVNLQLLQAVSKDKMEEQCLATSFSELEDVFPVIRKYTGSNADHAFAVAYTNGRRLLFNAHDDDERDDWMKMLQNFLGISDEE